MMNSLINIRMVTVSVLIGTMLFAVSALTVGAAQDTGKGPVRMIVTFEEGVFTGPASQEALARHFGGQVELPLPFMNAVAVSLPSQASAKALAQLPGVTGVYEDVEMSLVKKPTDKPGKPEKPDEEPTPEPSEVVDWGVDLIDADEAWILEVPVTGADVNVAILDTGIDADHPDLAANVAGGIGYVAREDWYNDSNGHGTHVAGTVASVANTVGYVGVAPEANIYAVQVLNRRGSGYVSALLSGINWAIENDIDVISMSLSFRLGTDIGQLVFGESTLAGMLDAAEAAGIVIIAAAGNEGVNDVPYPAAYPSVVAVAATNYDDSLASYSNYGTEVDVAAPGTSITSTWKKGGYNTISGTSMATPHVAGVAALILGQGIVDTDFEGEDGYGRINDEVFSQLVASTVTHPVGAYDFGRIDAVVALEL